jgi:hypothetical protein
LCFSILARRLLKRGEFRSVQDLVATTAGPSRPADMPTTNAELY